MTILAVWFAAVATAMVLIFGPLALYWVTASVLLALGIGRLIAGSNDPRRNEWSNQP